MNIHRKTTALLTISAVMMFLSMSFIFVYGTVFTSYSFLEVVGESECLIAEGIFVLSLSIATACIILRKREDWSSPFTKSELITAFAAFIPIMICAFRGLFAYKFGTSTLFSGRVYGERAVGEAFTMTFAVLTVIPLIPVALGIHTAAMIRLVSRLKGGAYDDADES